MAEALDVRNVDFLQADILQLESGEFGRDRPETFDIIECTGVLHHMAEPLRGWRILADRLRPGGLMQIGLYSAVSRRNLRRLREEDPAHPGPGCGADAARAYRHKLMARDEGETGAELVASHDFYTLSDFRDLALHESEYQFELPEIERFLAENHLEFAGFVLPPAQREAFAQRYPDDPLPGSLANWRAFEQENPHLFDAMYNFWCRKADTA
jgi:SAM-dependent methyltransferase